MRKFQNFSKKYGLISLAALHAFGLFTILAWDAEFFTQFSPLTLLFTAAIMVGSHQGNLKKLFTFLIITYFIGYGIELLGTQTGFPFGKYWYGNNLRPHFLGVPLVIGINWFILAMATHFVVKHFVSNPYVIAIVASIFMVGLDTVIEQVAPSLDYWHWQNDIVPFVNYLGWFVVSIIVQSLAAFWLGTHQNKVAGNYFWVVILFFMVFSLAL
jgi:putative membrane protein